MSGHIVILGLKTEAELPVGQPLPHVLGDLQQTQLLLPHAVGKEGHVAAGSGFDAFLGHIGPIQHLIDIRMGGVQGFQQVDAGADLRVESPAGNVEKFQNCGGAAAEAYLQLGRLPIVSQDGHAVAADAAKELVFLQILPDDLGPAAQKTVSGGVAEDVIDIFEALDVAVPDGVAELRMSLDHGGSLLPEALQIPAAGQRIQIRRAVTHRASFLPAGDGLLFPEKLYHQKDGQQGGEDEHTRTDAAGGLHVGHSANKSRQNGEDEQNQGDFLIHEKAPLSM